MSKQEKKQRAKKQTQILEDPNDPVYLKTCFVCSEAARPGHDHYRNYGGIVCYSCRAFWRRSHQKTRTPEFKCKKSGKCVTSIESRRKCKKCRYVRCLKAGMNPDAVLNVDQKKIRFRKHLQRLSGNKNNDDETVCDEMSEEEEEVKDEVMSSLPGLDNHDLSSSSFFQDETPETSSQTSKPSEEPWPDVESNLDDARKLDSPSDLKLESPLFERSKFHHPEESQPAFPDNLSLKAKSIARCYIISHSKSRFIEEGDFLKRIKAFCNGDMSVMIDQGDLFHLVTLISDDFKLFALQLWQFNLLKKSDQQLLFMKNAPLYVQLMLSFYLMSPEELKDSKVTSFDDNNMKKAWILNFIQSLHLETFNMRTNFFRSGSDLNHYSHLLIHLKSLPSLERFETRSVLAFFILFNTSQIQLDHESEKLLEEPRSLSGFLYNRFIRTSLEIPSMERFYKTLSQMALFCSFNVNWNNSSGHAMPYLGDFLISYTGEEESWLKLQVQAANEAYESVSVPSQLIRNYALHSKGYPLSPTHMPQYFKIMQERLFRILKVQPVWK